MDKVLWNSLAKFLKCAPSGCIFFVAFETDGVCKEISFFFVKTRTLLSKYF